MYPYVTEAGIRKSFGNDRLDLFSIKKSDGDNVSKLVLTIEYDDMSVEPATSKTCVKDLTLKDGFYILDGKLFNPDRMRIKAVKLKFERTGSSEIVYTSSFGTGEIIQPGQTAFLTVYHQESMPQYHYETNDFINHPTNGNLVYFAAHLDDVTFESAGFGDGRIMNAPNGSGYSYEYFLTDHLGSTRMVLNGQATVTEAIHYQPYGTVEQLPNYYNSALPVREKFTTKEFDEDGATDGENGAPGIGLFYFGARYYDAEVGLWISTDPVKEFHDAYTYIGNDPINGIDIDGKQRNTRMPISVQPIQRQVTRINELERQLNNPSVIYEGIQPITTGTQAKWAVIANATADLMENVSDFEIAKLELKEMYLNAALENKNAETKNPKPTLMQSILTFFNDREKSKALASMPTVPNQKGSSPSDNTRVSLNKNQIKN